MMRRPPRSPLFPYTPLFRSEKCAGKMHIRVCRTLSCAMAGSYQVMENFCAATGIQRKTAGDGIHAPISVSADGNLSIEFVRSEEHTSELQSQSNLVCRLLLE